MDYVVTRNRPGIKVSVPSKVKGDEWGYVMTYSGGKYTCYADDPMDLVGVLVGDHYNYFLLSRQQRLVCRIRNAISHQCWRQAEINVAAQCITMDWDQCTPTERAVLMGSRHTQPHGWDQALFGFADYWTSPVPILLVATAYSPYSDVPKPAGGTVWWIDPVSDENYLATLAAIGAIDLDIRV